MRHLAERSISLPTRKAALYGLQVGSPRWVAYLLATLRTTRAAPSALSDSSTDPPRAHTTFREAERWRTVVVLDRAIQNAWCVATTSRLRVMSGCYQATFLRRRRCMPLND